MDLRPGFPTVVDEVTVRLVASVVLVIGIVALVSGAWWLYAVLAVDFILRSVFGPRLSPIARFVLRVIRPRVPAVGRPTPGAPKRFAASIGAVLTSAATILAIVHLVTGAAGAAGTSTAVFAIGAIMVVFPALEAAAGVCVGCVIFAQLIRAGVVPERICLECADITRRTALASEQPA